MGSLSSLHDVQVRLGAFLDEHYHVVPHAGLLGKTPGALWVDSERDRKADGITEDQLRSALTVRERRRVRNDTTVGIDGTAWQLDQGFLAGRVVTVARSLLCDTEPPWIEHDGKRLPLYPVDVVANAKQKRPSRRPGAPASGERPPVPFDPAGALLDRVAGRRSRHAKVRS